MKPASANFYNQLAVETTTLCRLLRFTPKGRSTIYITDHDKLITYGGNDYLVTDAVEMSAINNAVGGAKANFELTVLFGDLFTRADAERGIYDGALIEIDLIFYDHIDYGIMPQAVGEVTDISIPHKSKAILGVVGFASRAERTLTEQYTPTCRADFCDARCGLDIEDFGENITVDVVSNGSQFVASEVAAQDDDFYNLGTLVWLTGDNTGTAVEVLRSTGTGIVVLMLQSPFGISVGDTARIYRGCDKTLAQCTAYANILNFRGEPYVPGSDFATKAPNATPPGEAGTPPTGFGGVWIPPA